MNNSTYKRYPSSNLNQQQSQTKTFERSVSNIETTYSNQTRQANSFNNNNNNNQQIDSQTFHNRRLKSDYNQSNNNKPPMSTIINANDNSKKSYKNVLKWSTQPPQSSTPPILPSPPAPITSQKTQEPIDITSGGEGIKLDQLTDTNEVKNVNTGEAKKDSKVTP